MNTPQFDASTLASMPNPGELLRTTREQQGLSLAGVSLQLNLSERTLAQIEAGDFSHLPGHTFARGYVRAYAKLLELDQAQVVELFDRYTGTDAKGSQVQSLGHIEEPTRLSSIGLRLVTLVLLFLLATLGFFLWQENNLTSQVSQITNSLRHVEVEAADGSVQVHSLEDTPSETTAPAPVSSSIGTSHSIPLPLNTGRSAPAHEPESKPSVAPKPEATHQAPSAPAPAPQPAPQPVVTPEPKPEQPSSLAPAAQTPAEEAAPQPPAESSDRPLVLHFTADCWSRVVDANGRVLLNGLMKAGVTQALQGKEPFSLQLGFARGVQVLYRGNEVDLAPYTRGSVARLKLGQ